MVKMKYETGVIGDVIEKRETLLQDKCVKLKSQIVSFLFKKVKKQAR